MNWTQDMPTQESWNWFRIDNEQKRTVIVYVISTDRMMAMATSVRSIQPLKRKPGLDPSSRRHSRNASRSREMILLPFGRISHIDIIGARACTVS